ncbi:hypothetical protein ACWF76_14970 [Streptomyces globisporus]|uniref:hypothetical protein n=1 Tax=Streptomyces globisporus TaxID=1908 RepID=UPI001981E505|nr:hypothetical protein [Streptomyces globisporus]
MTSSSPSRCPRSISATRSSSTALATEVSASEDVLGRPGRSYAQWARDHASDFTRTAG